MNVPIDEKIIEKYLMASGAESLGKAAIREIWKIANAIEKETGIKYVRMEMGVPGLPAPKFAVEAEKKALDDGCAEIYPPVDGIPEIKSEMSRFAKLFMDIKISPRSCIPTVGSINGNYVSLMVTGRMDKKKDTVLCIDPGFPVHKQMIKMLGLEQINFDVYNYRGFKLKEKLESYLQEGNISAILYSNPNNPSWISFTHEELKIIGELATKYDVVITEDLAYFGMDFRQDYSVPGKPPYQPTVAKYTHNYILLISSSKAFSYAGQRIGMMLISDLLWESNHNDLLRFYPSANLGRSMVLGTIYATTAGASHSAQYGLAAILKAVNNGEYNYIEVVKEYGKRAKEIKSFFIKNGFTIVYDTDIDQPIADGFYFTVSYPGFTGEELVEKLFAFGISAISLSKTGSERLEGIRVCVSHVLPNEFPYLKSRLEEFHKRYKGY